MADTVTSVCETGHGDREDAGCIRWAGDPGKYLTWLQPGNISRHLQKAKQESSSFQKATA